MGNSRTRSVNRVPKISQWEAYEMLPPVVRKALQEAMEQYDTVQIWKYNKKNGNASTIAWIKQGDRAFIKRGWIPARGRREKVPSPIVECEVTPLYANW